MDRLNKVRMNKSKFLSIPSCSRKEFQSIVDVMTESVPSGDGTFYAVCVVCAPVCYSRNLGMRALWSKG